MAVGDFNRDGIQDLAVVNASSKTVSVLLGKGDGTFGPPMDLAVGANPMSVAVGDFDGDTFKDLAVANFDDNTVSVLIGNGDGTFQPAQTVAVGNGPAFVAVGDFDGNAYQDLAVANFNSGNPGSVSVILGKPPGVPFVAEPTPIPVGNGPISLAVGDFDGDNQKDLAVVSYKDNTVSVLLGDGRGSFRPALAPQSLSPPTVPFPWRWATSTAARYWIWR